MGLLYSNYEANPTTNNDVNISGGVGIMRKTFRDSYFEVFNVWSPYGKDVLDKDNDDNIILQVMILNKETVIAEMISKSDYDRELERKKEDNIWKQNLK